MEELLKDQFQEYHKYHSTILIITGVIVFIVQIAIGWWVKKSLSKFSSKLKKAEMNFASTLKENEIKFSKYHLDQVEAYKILYLNFYEFRTATHRLLYFDEKKANHSNHKKKLTDWIEKNRTLRFHYNQNRILFPEDTCKKIDDNLNAYSRFTTIVTNEKDDIEDFEYQYDSNIQEMYGSHENEIDLIKVRARQLRESKAYKDAGKKMWSLIKELETDFRKLTK